MSFKDKLINKIPEDNLAKTVINPSIGKFKSKYLQTIDQKDVFGNLGISGTGSINPVGNTGVGKSKFDYNIPEASINKIDEIRASRQPWTDQLANAILGGAASGAIGALEGFTAIGDQLVNIGNDAEEWERGAISQLLYDTKKSINELTPVYRTDRDDTFDWNDSGFYFEVLKGAVDSAVAFGLPGAGYGMAVGKLGKVLGKAEIARRRLDVLTRAGGRALGIANPAQKLGAGASALLSNYNEGTVMGMQTYDEQKELLMNDLTQKLVNDKMKAGDETPLTQEELNDIEYKASIEAGKAAEYVRNFNHFMVASNYLSVRSLFNPVSSAARNMVKKPSFKNWVKDQMIGAPAEGAEEIAQGVLQNEVSFRNRRNFYKENDIDTGIQGFEEFNEMNQMSMGERLIDFATRDETLLEGMMGLISGPIQYAVTGAPGQSARNKALNEQYAKQQGIIGQNEEFIKDKLAFEENTEDLKQSFEDYSKNILNKAEVTDEDRVEFQNLIDNTSFDTLVVQNFFGGTTENLEKELQSVLQDENATEQEKQNADKYLKRLTELEQRYNNFQMYQDGAHMFAAQLRTERLQELSGILSKAYQQNEAELTKLINGRINKNSTKVKGKTLSMEDLLFFDEEVTSLDENGKEKTEITQVPVRSVQQAIDGILDGKTLKSKDGRVFNQTAFKSGKAFDVASQNRQGLRVIDQQLDFYNRAMNESKSREYENEFAKYQDALSNKITEEKINALKEFKTELYKNYPKKTTEEKYLNLKARVNKDISMFEKALEDAKFLEQQQNDEAQKTKEEEAQKAKEEKVAKKTGTTQPTSKEENDPTLSPDLPVTKTEDLFGNEATEQNNALDNMVGKAMAEKSKTPSKESKQTNNDKESKTVKNVTSEGNPIVKIEHTSKEGDKSNKQYVVDKNGDVYFHKPSAKDGKGVKVSSKSIANKARIKADPGRLNVTHKNKQYTVTSDDRVYQITSGGVTEIASGGDKPAILEKVRKYRSGQSITKETKTDTTKPVHILSDEDKKSAIDNYEPLPSLSDDDTNIAKSNITNVSNTHKNKLEKPSVNGKSDPTVAKLMTTGGTAEFQSKVLKNFKDKTGLQADLSITTVLPEGTDGKSASLAKKALAIYEKAKKSGKYTNDEFEFMVKYLPVSVDFGKGATTYIYPMNWKFDPEQNPTGQSKTQHEGEVAIRQKVITDSIKGNRTTIKIKGQLPGAINFNNEQKALSEIQLFENPMNAKMFVSIDGYLQNVDKSNPYNPFSEVFMQYSVNNNPQPWLGIFVVEMKALNGMSFPLKVNTKGHDDISAGILFDLYDAMISSSKDKNLMKVSIKQNDPALFERIKKAVPGIIETYGESVDYSTVINDMVFEGVKTKGRNTELYFEKGKVHFGNTSYNPANFRKNKAKFIDFIKNYKTFNVTASRLNDPKYRAHVFQNYLTTNADIDDMFTANATLNPEGDSFKRMQSGVMYVDVTSLETKVNQSSKQQTKIKEGVSELFDSNPELANIGTQEQYSQYLDTIFPDSKVKDIVYHGTNKKFETYTIKGDFGFHFGTKKAAEDRLEQKFKEDVKDYLYHVPEEVLMEDYNFIIKHNLINLKNPLRVPDSSHFVSSSKLDVFLEKKIITQKEYDYIQSLYPKFPEISKVGGMNDYFDELNNYQNNPQTIKANKEYQEIINRKISKSGYDGLVYKNEHEARGTDSYIVFEPEQIHILGSNKDIEGFKEFVGNKTVKTVSPEKIDKFDPFGFDDLSETESDKPKTWDVKEPKNKIEQMKKDKEEAKKKSEEIDRCKINKAAAKKSAKKKFGDDDIII